VSYLLDTNVISELVKKKPSRRVIRWIDSQPTEELYLSVLSLGEIRKGVTLLEDGVRRNRLVDWLERDLTDWFGDRLLPIDAQVADRWGRLIAQVGRPLPAIDSLIAATALQNDLRVATRNVADFQYGGIEVVNPWTVMK
jgi:toxin FitB